MADEAVAHSVSLTDSPASVQTVGLLVGSAEDKYENALLRGIAEVLQSAGVNLICFTSGALRSLHGFEAQRNVLYDLVNADNVNGLIISGTLAHSVSLAEIEALCWRYQPLPLVTVALQLAGAPSIMVDSGQGMQAVVEHLITVHGYRRIAFLRGPRGQQEAEDRYAAYVNTLAHYHLPVDPDLVLTGDYTSESGAAALHDRLARGSLGCEALVSANDSMALGALEVLQAHNVQVPAEFALTGFDDTEEGRFSTPSLTTVRQSVYQQGREAARLMLARLRGEAVPQQTTMPSALVVRQSCGCFDQRVMLAAAALVGEPDTAESSAAVWSDNAPSPALADLIAHAAPVLPAEVATAWLQRLDAAFVADLKGEQPGLCLQTLDALLTEGQYIDDNDGGQWHDVLSIMRAAWLPRLRGTSWLIPAEKVWHQARTLISERTYLRQARWRVQTEQRAALLRELSEAMVTSFNLADVLDVMAWELPRLRVKACYLSLFDEPGVSVEQARLILAFDQLGRQPVPPAGERFLSRWLVPPARLRCAPPYMLVVEVLYSKEERLGFVLFEVDALGASVCGALRGQLSSALQGVMLLEQRRQAETALQQHRDQLEQLVEARTLALVETNADLEAKNAELERFTYTVSHDLKAPLITIRGFLGFAEQDAQAGNWERFAVDMTRIVEATEKMRRLLDDLLELSRIGRLMNAPESMPLSAVVHEALQVVQGRIAARGVQIELEPDLPLVYGDRVRLVEVLQNLIDNACKFMGDQPAPRITIGRRGTDRDGKPIVSVADNGRGIDPQYHEKIFGLFNQLDPRTEGTGIGLALVKRIVEVHGGRIWVESAGQGTGSTFYFTLPDTPPA
jgi:DNA-binding LacI/PurR family transcriptional regulator/signal transduction histidine kinase